VSPGAACGEKVTKARSGAAGHPNKGYTVVQPYNTQLDFTNENFPGSVGNPGKVEIARKGYVLKKTNKKTES
jgi:hypothetical protein